MKYLKALSFEDFRSKILSGHVGLADTEVIPIANARGRILAENAKSAINVPHFRRAMRDGYAVRARDTFGATEEHPLVFKCIEEIPAGKAATKQLQENQCAYVATGSMLPMNADGVVMIEYTEIEDSSVKIKQAIPPDTFIIPTAKDIRQNEDVLPVGTLLTSVKLGVLSAIGLEQVTVFRKPRAGVISTGNEVLPSGSPLEMGKIYDINSITLSNYLETSGAVVTNYGIIPDDKGKLEHILRQAIAAQDITILSGGTSKGKEDLMPQLLDVTPEVDLVLHGARIKPGKPVIYARWKGKPLFVLPGYPTSCVLTYLVFVEPTVLQLGHFPPKEDKIITARLTSRVYSEQGRLEFKAVQIRKETASGTTLAIPIDKGSESITTLAKADGIFMINEMQTIVDEGEFVQVHLF